MSIELIKTLGQTLDEAALSDAINILVAARKERQSAQLLEMKNTLVPGDLVEFYHSQRKTFIRCVVKKTKTKKALVSEEGSSSTWDVPMGMLKKVGSSEK